jgi:hypothetical protein
MKEGLIRTDEENERHKQLVDTNRKRRELLKQQQESQLPFPQVLNHFKNIIKSNR